MQNSAQYPLALSWWEKDAFFQNLDVVIIGSGIVGLSAALHLIEQNNQLQILVIERGSLPSGASTRNAGFACFGSMTELLDDAQQQSEAAMLALVERRYKGLQRLKERVGLEQMDYHSYGGYELFRKSEEDRFQACADQMTALNRQLEKITGLKETFTIADQEIEKLGFEGLGHLICNHAEGQLHPGKMMRTLIQQARQKGIHIINGWNITEIESKAGGVLLHSSRGIRIEARQLLVATNGFAATLLPELALQPARNQVLITRPIKGLALKACFHYDRGYYYFRNIGNRLLLGGGRNLAPEEEQTDQFGLTKQIQAALINLLDKVILPGQKYEIEDRWSGILGIGQEKKPIVKKVENHIYTAVRMGGMGVAIGSLVGEEGADLLLASR